MSDDPRQTLVDLCDDEPANKWTWWLVEQIDTLNATLAAILASQNALYGVLTGVSATNPVGGMALTVTTTNGLRPSISAFKGARVAN